VETGQERGPISSPNRHPFLVDPTYVGVSKFEQMNLDMVSCGVPRTLDGAVEEYWQKSKFHHLEESVAWKRGVLSSSEFVTIQSTGSMSMKHQTRLTLIKAADLSGFVVVTVHARCLGPASCISRTREMLCGW
jgi:hypothetical protein